MTFSERHFAARGWVLAAALILLLVARARMNQDVAPLRPAWLLLVLAGIALRLWAGTHLGAHGNAARAQAPQLATGGPYRFSRNPLYLSNLLVAAGLVLYAHAFSVLVSALFILAILAHHILLVRHEEAVLAQRFGAVYAAYRREVPRWIGLPRTNGKHESGEEGAPPRTLGVRQGRNVAYTLIAVLAVWIAARWF